MMTASGGGRERATFVLTEKAIVLQPKDDVAVARAEIRAGDVLEEVM
jgi:hypothetical protein